MKPVVFLVGPTAAGKSEAAQALAEADGGAILSLDAMQVYRGLDIGTGKPTAVEQARVPHGGLDLVSWWEKFDVARYREAAAAFIAQCSGPLYIVGGTGLYFRALTCSLSEAPPAPPDIRARFDALSLLELQHLLRETDPGQSPDFDWENRRRVQRALEVIVTTGVSLREWQRRPARPPLFPSGAYHALFFQRDRDELRERIAARVEAMLRAGWIDEVRGLIAEKGIDAVLACPALGYGPLALWLAEGEKAATFPKVRQTIIDQTRQYARRQLTWFKKETTVQALMIARGERPSVNRLRTALESL